jgi:hypothetical protein
LKIKYKIFILLILFSGPLYSQYIAYDVPVISPATDAPMQFPFTGGFNNPQFSEPDVNFDGKNDLLVFDRSGNRAFVLERTSAAGEDPVFHFSLQYDEGIPAMLDWALMYDMDCNGIPDLFTYVSGSTAIYTGKEEEGQLVFDLFVDEITYTSSIELPVYTSRTDLPGFADVDGDSDMDILAFSVSGVQMRWYKNESVELGYGCDSLIYFIHSYCWGRLFEGATCSGADLGVDCLGEPDMEAERLHVGSTIILFDQDIDGDQDIILGDVSCDNLVFYENGGTPELADMVSKDTLFPQNSEPAKISEFPGAYLVDMNLDGGKDLLAAPNDDLLSMNDRNVLYYLNTTPGDSSTFEFVSNDFFSSNTIDVGESSHPAFIDINADGLMDLLIGIGTTKVPGTVTKYGLQYWRNRGTAAAPEYVLENSDQWGLNAFEMRDLIPAAGDADNDGDMDVVLGNYEGILILLENTAGPGLPIIMADPVFDFGGIEVPANAAPAIIDVDLDGKNDLIIGEQNGVLSYYRSVGSSYVLESDNWGGVDVRLPGDVVGYSRPFLFRNETGLLQLLVGSVSGSVFLYDEIEESMEGEFHEADTLFLQHNPGRFSAICAADINGDDQLEFAVGNIRGGLTLFQLDPSIAVDPDIPLPRCTIFPNPSTSQIYLSGLPNQPCDWKIVNLQGSELLSGSCLQTNQLMIDIRSLPAGLYMIIVHMQGDRFSATWIKQ